MGMIFSDIYEVFSTLQYYFAFGTLVFLGILTTSSRNRVLKILTLTRPDNFRASEDTSLRAALAWKYPEGISPISKSILTIKRKFFQYILLVTVGAIASLAFAVNATIDLIEDNDAKWVFDVEEELPASFTIIKVIYMGVAIAILRLLQVPKLNKGKTKNTISM